MSHYSDRALLIAPHPTAVLSIAGMICQHYGVLCSSGPWSFKTASSYITVIDAVSISCVPSLSYLS